MDIWNIFIVIYGLIALITIIPIIKALFKKVKLFPGGSGFDECIHFSENGKKVLSQHYTRIYGTLIFWKNKAELYRHLHYYCLIWTTFISVIIPVVAQFINKSNNSIMFLTLISLHSAIAITIHRSLKVEQNYQSFRLGESEFYDLYRRLLDIPSEFGTTEEEQIKTYFSQVETIRKHVRNAETNNTPSLNS